MRIHNILENGIKAIGSDYKDGRIQKTYQQFTVKDTKLDNGNQGTKIIKFSDQTPNSEQLDQIDAYEKEQELLGNPTQIKVVNVEQMKKLDLDWYCVMTPQEKDGSALNKIMFQDKLGQAGNIAKLTGRQLNADTFIQEYEKTWKIKSTFMNPQQQPPMGPEGEGGAGPEDQAKIKDMMGKLGEMKQSKNGAQIESGLKTSIKRPGARVMTQQQASLA